MVRRKKKIDENENPFIDEVVEVVNKPTKAVNKKATVASKPKLTPTQLRNMSHHQIKVYNRS